MEKLSKDFLKSRGKCCGNNCTNCPYYPKGSGSTVLVKKPKDASFIECLPPCNIKTMQEGLCICYQSFMEEI